MYLELVFYKQCLTGWWNTHWGLWALAHVKSYLLAAFCLPGLGSLLAVPLMLPSIPVRGLGMEKVSCGHLWPPSQRERTQALMMPCKCVCVQGRLTCNGKIKTAKIHHDRANWETAEGKKTFLSCFLNNWPWIFILHWALQMVFLALQLGQGQVMSFGVTGHLIARLKVYLSCNRHFTLVSSSNAPSFKV